MSMCRVLRIGLCGKSSRCQITQCFHFFSDPCRSRFMAERNTKPASSSNANATVAVRPSNSGSKSTTLTTASLLQQQTSQATQSMHISANPAAAAGATTVSNLSNLSQMAKILPQIVDGIVIFTCYINY